MFFKPDFLFKGRSLIVVFNVFLMLVLLGCEGILKLDLVGDGNVIVAKRQIRALAVASSVELSDDFTLEIFQSENRELWVECDSNLMAYVETLVEDETLVVRRKDNFSLSPRNPIIVRLYVDSLQNVDIYNGGSLVCDTMKFSNFEINNFGATRVTTKCLTNQRFSYYAEGGTDARLAGCFTELNIRQVGSGNCQVSGHATVASIVQEGSGKIDAYDLDVAEADVTLRGSGLIFCQPTHKLEVLINGKGRVYYRGNPILSSQIEGGGRLIQENP